MTGPGPAEPAGGRGDRRRAAERLALLEEVEVTIEKLVMGGEGLARYDGIPIFVPRSVPGDRLRVRLTQRRPDYARAEIVEVLDPGPGRRQPPCPHFDRCGGCDLQQIDDELQPRLKAAAVAETLRRLGRLEMPPPELVAGEPWAYRLRAQLHAAPDPAGRAAGAATSPAAAASWCRSTRARSWCPSWRRRSAGSPPRCRPSHRAGWIWRRGRGVAGPWRRWSRGCRGGRSS